MGKLTKKILCITLILSLVFALGACGNTPASESNPEETSTPAEASSEAESSEPSEVTSSDDALVIYTNSNSDGRGEWWEAKAKEAGFNITIVGAGGADLTNRLISEQANPAADVVFGLNTMFYEKLKSNDVLTAYTPAWSTETEEGTNDTSGFYHSLVKQALVTVYNTEDYDADTAPTGYDDLWSNEEFAGKYEVPAQMNQATAQIVISSILTRYQDENGEYGISEEGWNVLKSYFENGMSAIEGEEIYSSMANGKVSIGTAVSGTMKAKEEQYSIKVDIVHPEIGTPTIIEQIGLINGTKKEETAKAFIDWFGSAEVQAEFAKEFNAMPTNTVAAESANEAVKELYSNIKNQKLDWEFINENLELWVEKIELEIM